MCVCVCNVSLLQSLKYTNTDLKISLYDLVHIKQYTENFALLMLGILELFTREICIFLKK